MLRRGIRLLGATIAINLGLGQFATVARVIAAVCHVDYSVSPSRGSGIGVVGLGFHDYAPSVMKDGNIYKMWWCSNNNNREDIMYAEATSFDGPWTSPISVFQPTMQAGTFDRILTCDPSVIRVGGTYYLYYTGAEEHFTPPGIGRIGVASGPNGINWTRLNGGNAIISPARDQSHPDYPALPAKYGAGQQTVTYVDGKFYIIFTDTTAVGSNGPNENGAGQFVLRSPDPTFQSSVEEMTGPGIFTPYNPSLLRPYAFFEQHATGFALDWQYVDTTDSFAIADAPNANEIRISIYNGSLSRREGVVTISKPALWLEGPGLVSSPDRHQVPSSVCGVIPFDFMRAVGANIQVADLAHGGADWLTGLSCDCVSAPTLNALGYPAIGDFTGDSRSDLGSHHRSTGPFSIRRNLGNGAFEGPTWASGVTPPTPEWQTLIADFDGDNLADYADHHIASGQVWVHRNLANGSFAAAAWTFGYTAIGANIEVLAGDFDGDGRADLLEHNRKTGQLWVRRNMGPSSNAFTPIDVAITFRSQAGSGGAEWRIVVADFNSDGFDDVADVHVPSFQFWVHPNAGGYQFSTVSWSPIATFSWPNFTTVFGDFDGDGWADYADVNRSTGEIWAHRNQHNGMFDQGNNLVYGIYPLGSGGMWILGVPVGFP